MRGRWSCRCFKINIMSEVIVTTREELRCLIYEAVGSIIPKLANYRPKEPTKSDTIDMEEVAGFLKTQGVELAKATIYILVSKGDIPHRKVGHRTIFLRRELREWAKTRIKDPEERKREVAANLAKAADRQLRREAKKRSKNAISE